MKKKHTPGPWHLNPDDHQGIKDDCRAVHAPDGEIICEYVSTANGTLITAAPDMVSALKSFAATFGQAIDNDEEINGADAVDALGNLWRDKIKPALQKADQLQT